MVSYTTPTGSNIWDVRGLSTDEKPTENVPNGSTYYEIDGEHRIFMFDSDTKKWWPQ